MLSENIKEIRKAKGLSQEELAVKLNVVRQTVSKWEQGLSVPDADMLLSLSKVLETSVDTLLGETVAEARAADLKAISEKSEEIRLLFAKRKLSKLKVLYWLMLSLSAVIIVLFACLIVLKSPYLSWDFGDPETAVAGTLFHAFEYLFVRIAPIAFIVMITGCIIVRRKIHAHL